jgi:hypothetical protein
LRLTASGSIHRRRDDSMGFSEAYTSLNGADQFCSANGLANSSRATFEFCNPKQIYMIGTQDCAESRQFDPPTAHAIGQAALWR